VIISRTPFRFSFAGGGTDLAAYYHDEPGAVLSTALNKYMYVTVNKYFDDKIILKYSTTEAVGNVREIKHPLIKEALKMTGIERGVEITSMADIVGGTGLGSSSSFTVGVLHALHAFTGDYVPLSQLASEACEIEIDRVKEPIGKQDQYIAAYGGFQFIEFMPDEAVRVTPIICSAEKLQRLNNNLLLFYTGKTRSASKILKDVKSNMGKKKADMRELRNLADAARHELQNGSISKLGDLMHEGWLLKRSLHSGISNPEIDRVYKRARKAGAKGGKIAGAGGGGFMMLYVPRAKQAAVRKSMRGWREVKFRFEPEGSKIIHLAR
jgi:D-glycero-alpha-D-manno-heptose-7-phosphate kinase